MSLLNMELALPVMKPEFPGELGQYNDWCPASFRFQVINSHDISYVGYTGPWVI